MPLNYGTVPLDREEKARYHEQIANRCEAYLAGGWVSKREEYQREMEMNRRIAAKLREPIVPNGKGRMKSFVGTDSYEYNG